AKTVKGKGLKFLENKNGWHGKALGDELVQAALTEIPNPKFPNVKVKKPINDTLKKINLKRLNLPEFKVDDEIATREAYGLGLLNLAEHDPNIMVLDAEVSNSTHAETVKKKHPEQFIECYIAEQNMVGVGQGLAVCGYTVFMSTFAAFLTRAHDQIRMAALSNSKFIVCGSHCGVSIGEDGASQMGLEDIALFRALPNSVVLYPADAVATLKLMELATKQTGITYIRTTRPKVPVIYANNEKFLLGGFKAVKQTTKDKVVLVGAGITLYEALKAYELLAAKGVAVAVVDLYCVKPFDHTKFKQFVRRHGGKVVVVEDHRPEGGIGEMIAAGLVDEEFVVEKLAIDTIPHSGTKDELLNKYGIGAKHIVEAALRSLKRKR
ncbi:transketolase, partial [archaeon]|nr:transketolase [archaeon]